MDVDRFNTPRDETLISRRPWYALAAALLVLSAVAHQPLAFLAALFALVIGIVPEIWYRYALRHLIIHQHVSEHRVFFGETNVLSITVENQKLLPLPWLEIEDEIPSQITLLSGRASPSYKVNRAMLVNSVSLWSYQRVTRRYRIRCTARGVYTSGPAMLRSGDPFGWLVREEQRPARETLLVYPLVAPVEAFGLPPRRPFGEGISPGRLLEDPLRIAGVREYVLGDDPRRIHWKATARAGELQSKVYEPSGQYRLLLLLDINTYKESWMGLDPEIQELTIAATASLGMWALEGSIEGVDGVSVAEASMRRVYVPLASDGGQRERILSALARLLPYFGSPMDRVIDAERFTVSGGTTVVLVSTAAVLSEATIDSLLNLR